MSSLCCRRIVIVACLLSPTVAYGQRFTYGLKGGVPLTEPDSYGRDESKKYIVGASFEYRLWSAFAVEVDFLYRRNGGTFGYGYNPYLGPGAENQTVSITYRSRLNVFELPVLGKYYFRRNANLQPFVLTGYSFRKSLTDDRATVTTTTDSGLVTRTDSGSNWTPLDVGATFGAGLRFRRGRVGFSPEIRYTRWGGNPATSLTKHQADFLFGITF